MATTVPMPVHKAARVRATIRFRAEKELKRKIAILAAKARRSASSFMRDKLWQIVEEDEARNQAGSQRSVFLPDQVGETGADAIEASPITAAK